MRSFLCRLSFARPGQDQAPELLHRRGLQREAVAASPGLGNGASEGGRAESGGHGAVTTDRNDLAFVRNFHAQTSGAAGKNCQGHGSCPCL